jgi:hypothetical protein
MLDARTPRSQHMAYKQKQAIPKDAPKAGKAMEQQMHENVKFRRGIEAGEMHRQGGNRVPDQGNRKK